MGKTILNKLTAYFAKPEANPYTGDREHCIDCNGFGYRYDRGLRDKDAFCKRCEGTGQAPVEVAG